MRATQYELLMRKLGGEYGSVARELQRQLKPGTPAYGTAGYARDILTTAVDCLMVGMEREALDLLAKSDEWMTAALESVATGGAKIALEYNSHFEHAVCRWLLGPPFLAHDLTRGCELLQQSEMMALANVGEYADMLDSALAMLVYAEHYDECIAKFECEKAKDPRSQSQIGADAMRDFYAGKIAADEAAVLHHEHSEAPMAYLIARERLKPTLNEQEWKRKFEPFLRQQVPQWLKYARYDEFAMWIRIITQAEAGEPARAAVRAIADQYA